MNNILQTVTSNKLSNEHSLEQIINYINMALSVAHDKEVCLTTMEANTKAIKNTLEDLLHVIRNHPLHRLNKTDTSVLYTLDEAQSKLKLDRQKIIRMIKNSKLAAVKDGKKYLLYRWSVDEFVYSYSSTTLQQSGATSTTMTGNTDTKKNTSNANGFTLDVFKQGRTF